MGPEYFWRLFTDVALQRHEFKNKVLQLGLFMDEVAIRQDFPRQFSLPIQITIPSTLLTLL
jgi:hypothetical protein